MKKFLITLTVTFAFCNNLYSKKNSLKNNTETNIKHFLKVEKSPILSLDFSDDNTFITSVGLSGYINIYDFQDETLDTKLKPKTLRGDKAISVDFADKSNKVLSVGTIKNKVYDLNILNNSILSEKKYIPSGSCFNTMSKDNKFIFTSAKSKEGGFKMINLIAGKVIRTYSGHKTLIRNITLSNDNNYIVTADKSNVVKLWDPLKNIPIYTIKHKAKEVTCLRFSTDNKNIYISSLDGHILCFDIEKKDIVKSYYKKGSRFYSLAVSDDGKHIAGGTGRGEIIIFSTESLDTIIE